MECLKAIDRGGRRLDPPQGGGEVGGDPPVGQATSRGVLEHADGFVHLARVAEDAAPGIGDGGVVGEGPPCAAEGFGRRGRFAFLIGRPSDVQERIGLGFGYSPVRRPLAPQGFHEGDRFRGPLLVAERPARHVAKSVTAG
jgi:hypothetical protein